jgi:thiol-disulfide isomerase/thioredoxin
MRRIDDLDHALLEMASVHQAATLQGKERMRRAILRRLVRRLPKARSKKVLQATISDDEAGKLGNPLIVIAIIGILVNLLWQWWLDRKRDKDLVAVLVADAERTEPALVERPAKAKRAAKAVLLLALLLPSWTWAADATVSATVAPTEHVVVYGFTAKWCPHCPKMKAAWESLRAKGHRVVIVDVDEQPQWKPFARRLPQTTIYRFRSYEGVVSEATLLDRLRDDSKKDRN